MSIESQFDRRDDRVKSNPFKQPSYASTPRQAISVVATGPSTSASEASVIGPPHPGPPHQNSQGFEPFSMIIPSADISCTIVVIS